MLTDTLRAAERIGVEARLVRSAYDVDTIDDLRRLERDLTSAPPDVCPGVRRWLRENQANGLSIDGLGCVKNFAPFSVM